MSYPNDPFFIVGCARSGTTILRLMLNEHSRLHVPYESHFIANLLDSLPWNAPLTRNDLALAHELILQSPPWKRHFWNIPNEELRIAILALQEATLARLISEVFQISCRRSGKARWGDKTPAYTERIGDLHQIFPQAQFIHIIRDARDVSSSLCPYGWHGTRLHQTAHHWQRIVSQGARSGRALGPELYLEITYEDLVQRTDDTLRQVCTFLGEPYETGMLEFYRHTDDNIPREDNKVHVKTSRSPQDTDAYRWRREMNLFQVAFVEAFAGATMDLVGQKRRFAGLPWLLPCVLKMVVWAADYTRPARRRLGIKLPPLNRAEEPEAERPVPGPAKMGPA